MQLTRKRIRGSISQSGVNRIDKTQPSPEFAHASQLKKRKQTKNNSLVLQYHQVDVLIDWTVHSMSHLKDPLSLPVMHRKHFRISWHTVDSIVLSESPFSCKIISFKSSIHI